MAVRLKDSREKEFELIKLWRKRNIHPPGGRFVPGQLDECITLTFGSIINFVEKFTATAVAGRGTVQTQLVWSPSFQELEILQVESGQDPAQWGVIPLFTVDKRMRWLEAWWGFVDWEEARRRYIDLVHKEN